MLTAVFENEPDAEATAIVLRNQGFEAQVQLKESRWRALRRPDARLLLRARTAVRGTRRVNKRRRQRCLCA
jgi:hypothetical protein